MEEHTNDQDTTALGVIVIWTATAILLGAAIGLLLSFDYGKSAILICAAESLILGFLSGVVVAGAQVLTRKSAIQHPWICSVLSGLTFGMLVALLNLMLHPARQILRIENLMLAILVGLLGAIIGALAAFIAKRLAPRLLSEGV